MPDLLDGWKVGDDVYNSKEWNWQTGGDNKQLPPGQKGVVVGPAMADDTSEVLIDVKFPAVGILRCRVSMLTHSPLLSLTPGKYVIESAETDGVALTEGADMVSHGGRRVCTVEPGTVVTVVELMRQEENARIRGRIHSPPGWISLWNLETGHQWAKQAGNLVDAASSVAGQLHDELPGIRPDEAERRLEAVRSLAAQVRDEALANAGRDCDAAAAHVAEQTEKQATMRVKVDEAQAALSRLNSAREQQEAERASLTERVTAVEADLRQARDHAEKLEKDLQQARKNIRAVGQNLARTRQSAKDAQQKVQRTQRKETTAAQDVERLSADGASADNALENARVANRAADCRRVELRSVVDRTAGGIAAVEAAIPGRWQAWERMHAQWDLQDVALWLRRTSDGTFAAHADEFVKQGVTGAMLAEITHDELTSLGIRNLGLRRRLRDAIAALADGGAARDPSAPPHHLVCPLTFGLFEDPVVIAGDRQGSAYERSAIERWLRDNHTVPGTRQLLPDEASRALQPLYERQREARAWQGQHGQ